MIGPVCVFLDKQEYKLAGQLGLVGESGFKRDYRRAGFASGACEAVHVDDPPIVGTENREPRVQIFAKDLMLRGGMRLYRPERVFGNCHGNPLKQI